MRSKVMSLIQKAGVARMLTLLNRRAGKRPVVVFHRVHPKFDHLTQPIHPNEFREFLDLMLRLYVPYTMDDINTTEERACFITFDDATLDFYEYVYPILKEMKVPATLFVPVNSIQKQERIWNNELMHAALFATKDEATYEVDDYVVKVRKDAELDELLQIIKTLNSAPSQSASIVSDLTRTLNAEKSEWAQPMSWSQIEEVSQNGVLIGSHSLDHLSYEFMLPDEAINDSNSSQAQITKMMGEKPMTFAFPMGHVNHLDAVKRNYKIVCSTEPRLYNINENGPVPRISIYDTTAPEMLLRMTGFHSLIRP